MKSIFNPGKYSIQGKLVIIIMSISTVTLLMASSLFTLFQLQEHRLLMVDSLTSVARITSENVQAAVMFDNSDDADKVLAEFSNDPRIVAAAIYTFEKQLFSSFIPTNEAIPAYHDFPFPDKPYRFEGDYLHIYQPMGIVDEDNMIGYIYLVASLDTLYLQLKQNILFTFIVVLISLLITVLLTSRLQRLISKPILELSRTTNTIKNNKDYTIRVEQNDYLEIAQLSEGFNSMLEEIQKRDEDLQLLATYDILTGLANRKYFTDILQQAINRGTRKSQRHAIFFMDLDRFKHINDSLGHSIGDELIVQVANRLLIIFRNEDTVARFGGDEFTFLCEDIATSYQATEVAERVVEILTEPFMLRGHSVTITPSIGISLFPDHGITTEDLLKKADTAMYRAKKFGGNNHWFFTDELNEEAQRRQELEEGLRDALLNDEFILHYQPQVDLQTGEIVGLEALTRWNRIGNGLIPPNRFIPLAEETGLIIPIGKQILSKAVLQAKDWTQNKLLRNRVAVNISPKQFRQPDFFESIKNELDEANLNPEYLEIELTEAALMENTNEVITIMNELKDYGVKLAIDDFGTGYSSLSYLKEFPIDTLKIDMLFIRDMGLSEINKSIVKAIIDLAHTLNMEVVAEGIEKQSQVNTLREMNCNIIQGYLFSKPLEHDDITEMLQKDINLYDLKHINAV